MIEAAVVELTYSKTQCPREREKAEGEKEIGGWILGR
jgi:hypothetical protein